MTVSTENIINVTISSTPSGLSNINVNSVGFFSTETPSHIDPFRIYLNAEDVAADWGSNSVTTAMANNVFSQSPNILSGNGRLVIAKLESAVSATSGDATTDDISANLANFQAVADGDIKIVVNGVDYDLTGLDFTGVTSLADIATIIQRQLKAVALVTATATTIQVKSLKVGATSTADIQQLVGSGTDLSIASLFNIAALVITVGVDSSGETIVDAIARTSSSVSYTGIMTNLDMEDAVLTTLASSIQATDYILVHHLASKDDLAGVATTIKDAAQDRTRLILNSTSVADANLTKAAEVGRAFSVNFAGSSTTQSMHLKTLTNVVGDANIDNTILALADDAGVTVYPSIDGRITKTLVSGANGFFDQVYNATWIKDGLEVAGFNHLAQTDTKVPQTEEGMIGLKSALSLVLEQSVTNGYIGAGNTWNGSTFGNPEDLRRLITDQGYYIFSLPISQQSQVDRDARKAPLIQIAIKEAGAIHSVTINVFIEA